MMTALILSIVGVCLFCLGYLFSYLEIKLLRRLVNDQRFWITELNKDLVLLSKDDGHIYHHGLDWAVTTIADKKDEVRELLVEFNRESNDPEYWGVRSSKAQVRAFFDRYVNLVDRIYGGK